MSIMRRRGVHTVLELGGGHGLTATRLAAAGAHVTTVEREGMRSRAIGDLAVRCGVADRVHVVSSDALSATLHIEGTFDLILIDAAKSEYTRLFRRYCPQLATAGVIISDNMAFHGIVSTPSLTHNRGTKALARHLAEYADFLRWHPDFATYYSSSGDGVAISVRKGDFAPLAHEGKLLFTLAHSRYIALHHEGSTCALKVLPDGTSEDQARCQARLLAHLSSSHASALTPIDLVRVGSAFALRVTPQPARPLLCELKQARCAKERDELLSHLVALQRRIAHLDTTGLPSYKDVLRRAAGGDSLEAAPLIHAIKRLPGGAEAAMLCKPLEELLLLEGGDVCYAGDGCLCSAPFEFVLCTTWQAIGGSVGATAARSYLAIAGASDVQLHPFALVIKQLGATLTARI